uniref:uncharacterized protein LOC120337348 n=1 Tax=Styela clava TaxID=7725 RepID=UPI0019392CF9|nr:uncharacterized protein LOC120337348 [Styela clava]
MFCTKYLGCVVLVGIVLLYTISISSAAQYTISPIVNRNGSVVNNIVSKFLSESQVELNETFSIFSTKSFRLSVEDENIIIAKVKVDRKSYIHIAIANAFRSTPMYLTSIDGLSKQRDIKTYTLDIVAKLSPP